MTTLAFRYDGTDLARCDYVGAKMRLPPPEFGREWLILEAHRFANERGEVYLYLPECRPPTGEDAGRLTLLFAVAPTREGGR